MNRQRDRIAHRFVAVGRSRHNDDASLAAEGWSVARTREGERFVAAIERGAVLGCLLGLASGNTVEELFTQLRHRDEIEVEIKALTEAIA